MREPFTINISPAALPPYLLTDARIFGGQSVAQPDTAPEMVPVVPCYPTDGPRTSRELLRELLENKRAGPATVIQPVGTIAVRSAGQLPPTEPITAIARN